MKLGGLVATYNLIYLSYIYIFPSFPMANVPGFISSSNKIDNIAFSSYVPQIEC